MRHAEKQISIPQKSKFLSLKNNSYPSRSQVKVKDVGRDA